MDKMYVIAGCVLVGLVIISSGYMQIKTAFVDIVNSATQTFVAEMRSLSEAVKELKDEMKLQRETQHDIELKLKELDGEMNNTRHRVKTLEEHCKKMLGNECI